MRGEERVKVCVDRVIAVQRTIPYDVIMNNTFNYVKYIILLITILEIIIKKIIKNDIQLLYLIWNYLSFDQNLKKQD